MTDAPSAEAAAASGPETQQPPAAQSLRLTSSAVSSIKSAADILKLVPERPLPEWIKTHKRSGGGKRQTRE